MHIHSWPTLGTCRRCHCEDRSLGIACSDLFFSNFYFFLWRCFFFFAQPHRSNRTTVFFVKWYRQRTAGLTLGLPSLSSQNLCAQRSIQFFLRGVFLFLPLLGGKDILNFFWTPPRRVVVVRGNMTTNFASCWKICWFHETPGRRTLLPQNLGKTVDGKKKNLCTTLQTIWSAPSSIPKCTSVHFEHVSIVPLGWFESPLLFLFEGRGERIWGQTIIFCVFSIDFVLMMIYCITTHHQGMFFFL